MHRPGVRPGVAANLRAGTHRSRAALLALSLLLAACGGAAPPANPGNAGNPGGAPTLRPVTGSLTDLLPTQVSGETLTVQGGDGSDGLALLPDADVESITEQLDKLGLTPDRLSVAVAGDMAAANDDGGISVAAVRVPGVLFTPSSGPQITFVKNLLGVTGTTRTGRATLGGKTTATFRQTSDDSTVTTYIYSPTEVIFIARGPEALVEEVFRSIPERP